MFKMHTSKETPKFFGLIGVIYTIEEAIVLVRLHAGLDAVQGKGDGSRKHAGGAGSDLGAVPLDQPLWSLLMRHGLVW
jgi:hypothetical protein